MSNQRADATGAQFTVIFNNQSGRSGNVCIYQQQPDPADPEVFSTAWLVQAVADDTQGTFRWQLDYSFVWGQTGILAPGVLFEVSQHKDANGTTGSSVNFGQDSIGSFTFDEPTPGPRPSVLVINEGNFMRPPPGQDVSVGIGVFGEGSPGQPVFAKPAQPNSVANFRIEPRYFIAFGTYVQGEIVDVNHMTLPEKLSFDAGVFSLTATLDSQNLWHITSTAEANTKFLKAVRTNSTITWGEAQIL